MLSKYLWQDKEVDEKKLASGATVKPQAGDYNNFDTSSSGLFLSLFCSSFLTVFKNHPKFKHTKNTPTITHYLPQLWAWSRLNYVILIPGLSRSCSQTASGAGAILKISLLTCLGLMLPVSSNTYN